MYSIGCLYQSIKVDLYQSRKATKKERGLSRAPVFLYGVFLSS